jgi:hypothetical protein
MNGGGLIYSNGTTPMGAASLKGMNTQEYITP